MPRPTTPLRWAERTPIERVRLYVVGSLYFLFVFFMVLAVGSAVATLPEPALDAFAVGLGLVLTAGGLLCLRAALEVDAPRAPDRVALGLLLARIGRRPGRRMDATARERLQPGHVRGLRAVLGSRRACEDRRVWWAVVAVSPVLGWTTSHQLGLAAYAAGVAAFLVFTVRSSLWLLRVVERARARTSYRGPPWPWPRSGCASPATCTTSSAGGSPTIAVQAELASDATPPAATSAPPSTSSATSAPPPTTALREARELARGYRPSTSTTSSRAPGPCCGRPASRRGRPRRPAPAWHEPVAWVVREAVTNVLRHSRATLVTITYDDGGRAHPQRRAPPRRPAPAAHGLVGLGERLAPLGATLETARDGDELTRRAAAVACPPRRPRMIRVLLVDDEHLIRTALAQMLDLEDDLEVVAQAAHRRRRRSPLAREVTPRRGGARPAAARPRRHHRRRASWPQAVPGCALR